KPTGYAAAMEWVQETTLDDIQKRSDIVSLHLPLTAETRHLVDKEFIDRCKRGFVLINTSRGGCVRTEDVVAALEDGRIGGACLDVLENEKPATFSEAERQLYARLHTLENVVLTPHIAGWTHESKRMMAELLVEK